MGAGASKTQDGKGKSATGTRTDSGQETHGTTKSTPPKNAKVTGGTDQREHVKDKLSRGESTLATQITVSPVQGGDDDGGEEDDAKDSAAARKHHTGTVPKDAGGRCGEATDSEERKDGEVLPRGDSRDNPPGNPSLEDVSPTGGEATSLDSDSDSDDGDLGPSYAQRVDAVKDLVKEACISVTNFDVCGDWKNVRSVLRALETLQAFPLALKHEDTARYREASVEIGDIMTSSKAAEGLCAIVVSILREGFGSKENDPRDSSPRLGLLHACVLVLLNASDASPSVAKVMVDHPDLFPQFGSYLKDKFQSHKDGELSHSEEELLVALIDTISNTCAFKPNDTDLREMNFTTILLPYLSSPSEELKISVLCCLADIVDEEGSELLSQNVDSISLLLDRLKTALASGTRECLVGDTCWSILDITRAIRQLARNRPNAELLVDQGCLSLLTEVVGSKDKYEKKLALESVWMLAFNEKVKVKILEEPGLLDTVVDCYKNSKADEMKAASEGILWTMGDVLMQDERYREVAAKVSKYQHSEEAEVGDHIMISYNRGSRETMKKVAQQLRQHGFKVWMDVTDMSEGSTLQTMAEAVEKAWVILICFSQNYKDSPNCRAEGEYAFLRNKPMMPVKVQSNYTPDGWLGILLGTKKFYDFTNKYPFQAKMDELIKDVHTVRKSQSSTVDGPTSIIRVDDVTSVPASQSLPVRDPDVPVIPMAAPPLSRLPGQPSLTSQSYLLLHCPKCGAESQLVVTIGAKES